MGRKGISVEALQSEIDNILDEYVNDVVELTTKVGLQYAKIGKRRAASESPRLTGHYARGWAYAVTKKPSRIMPAVYDVHNKTDYQLTHLLEFGHAKRGGGRVAPKPHIMRIRKEIQEGFANDVARGIGRL